MTPPANRSPSNRHRLFIAISFMIITSTGLRAALAHDAVEVKSPDELRRALAEAKPGSTIRIAARDYPGGFSVQGVADLTIEAREADNPPHFQGGGNALQCSRCPGLTIKHLKVSGQRGNGINIDDGGTGDQLVDGVTLEGLTISDIGPRGNCDAIKCSGIKNLTIRKCTIEGWGGQGIDMVGCHDVTISECKLIGKEGFSASAGIQMKGGSSNVTVEKCTLLDAGERALNVGGSTGLPYFRPKDAKHEAAKITIKENVIKGSMCSAAFVGVDGATFERNQIRMPKKWIFRILQENRSPGFVPARNVVIKENVITFRRAQVSVDVNIGDATAPETFRFEKNHWLAEDRPQASTPKLPTKETGGTYGKKPGR